MNFEIENNNDNFIYSASHKIITEIVKNQDEATLKAIQRYCKENNIIPNIIEEDKLREVLELGIAEYNKTHKENEALRLLLNWAEECDWGFDNFRDDDVVNWEEFEKISENLDYIESMIKYAEMYLENKGE